MAAVWGERNGIDVDRYLKEKFTKFFYIAAGLSLGGMTLLLGESFQFNKEQFLGDLLGVLTAVWYGSYIITISQLRKKYNTTSIMFISGIITSIILIVISLIVLIMLQYDSFKSKSTMALLNRNCVNH